jgi:uncharacterized membrane protein
MTNEEKINLIGQKILILSNNLDKYSAELKDLRQQLAALQQSPKQKDIVPPPIIPPVKVPEPVIEKKEIKVEEIKQTIVPPVLPPPPLKQAPAYKAAESNFNFEEFIGSKLITIIGIVILVIGLGIGVKYAIDRDLITELTRIVLAYVAGAILLLIAFKLKKNYKTFSAVLLSGAMASLYFTTFAAYSMYQLFGQLPAFVIMVLFTAFTVFAATIYSLQVIAIIGLVGAYAVPMLLSDGSGRIEIMFGYMTIINTGIMVLAFKKYWQLTNQLAFFLTWMIVGVWFMANYAFEYELTAVDRYFGIVMGFSFIFFLIFYISTMAYKIIRQEKFNALDVIRILVNSFAFFGIGYAAMNNEWYEQYLGLFTLANAVVHFAFSYIVFKNKLLDRKMFYFLIALVLCFITLAVPVQLEGNWVTLFWAAEAALLFVIGRYKSVRFYEWLGFAMSFLAVCSLVHDWNQSYLVSYYNENLFWQTWRPLLNIQLLTSLFVLGSLGTILYVHNKKALSEEEHERFPVYKVFSILLSVTLFVLTYLSFSNEIIAYYSAAYEKSLVVVPSTEVWAEPGAVNNFYDSSLLSWKAVMLNLYSLLYLIIFCALSIRRWTTDAVRWTSFGLNMIAALIFLMVGLASLSALRGFYLNQESTPYFVYSNWMITIRYISLAAVALLLFLTRQLLGTSTFKELPLRKLFSGCIVHFFILIMLSNELVNIYRLNYSANMDGHGIRMPVYKMGFTVLWSIYSFLLIAWGIFRKNKIARISAISLFGITLIKLVTFDTWDLSTGYKVIAYILLGVVLLVVAFLYQKFKLLIFGNDNTDDTVNKTSEEIA